MVSDESKQIATHVAQKLRDAGVGCAMLDLVPTQPAVLRQDRIVIGLALIFLTALAWSYVLWFTADMHMGGMNMSGFRCPLFGYVLPFGGLPGSFPLPNFHERGCIGR